MLRLRSCVLTHLLSPSATYPAKHPVSSLLRLLSAAAPAGSPIPSFAVEKYLVDSCGLTRAQALKASAKISHLKSPAKPNAVLAFLAGLGLSSADVAKDPLFLCAGVERTLAPVLVGLTGLGLSRSDIVSLIPNCFRCKSIVSNLPYHISLFGSYENLLRALKASWRQKLLSSDLESVVKPNAALLRECGLGACDIAELCILVPWLLSCKQESLQVIVACAEGLGVPRGSPMFRQVLRAVGFESEENIAARLGNLKKTFSWPDAEVRTAVCKAPIILMRSKETLRRRSEFLISEAGLEPAYIARRPALLMYSLGGRLRPRHYVLKFLKEKGLLHQDRDYYGALVVGDKVFMEKFICPHKEAAPHLAEDYAAACSGEVPTRFKFT